MGKIFVQSHNFRENSLLHMAERVCNNSK